VEAVAVLLVAVVVLLPVVVVAVVVVLLLLAVVMVVVAVLLLVSKGAPSKLQFGASSCSICWRPFAALSPPRCRPPPRSPLHHHPWSTK
jgi:hypothetical protein